MPEKKETRKVIVIGGAVAGCTAAIYLARAQLKPLLLAGEKAGGQLMLTTSVENYPGFPEGIEGPDLVMAIRAQAEKFGAEIKNVDVVKVDFSRELKQVWTGEGLYQAKAVVITSGARPRLLNVGEENFLGKGVSTCATCDAAFYKDKVVYLVGGGDMAMEDVLTLRKFTSKVSLIHRRDSLRASKIMQKKVLEEAGVPVLWNSEVVGVRGGQKLEAIKVKNNKTGDEKELLAEGLFLAVGHLPESNYLKDQVEVDDHGYILTKMLKDGVNLKQEMLTGYLTQTSATGVFAAGDVVDFRYRQAVTAAGMGCQAALDAEKFLTGRASSW